MRLYICGLDKVQEFRFHGVTHILSLLDVNYRDVIDNGCFQFEVVTEADHLFESFLPHKRLELKFDDISTDSISPQLAGYIPPTHDDVDAILAFGRTLTEDDSLLVHCHAGISRSSAAAALILLQAFPRKPATEIFDRILKIRRIACPNELILKLGGEILNRKEEIMEAAESQIWSEWDSQWQR